MENWDSKVSLDAIIDYILDGDAGEIPKFVRDCEKKVKDGLLDYTGKIRQTGTEGQEAGWEAETFVEENSGELQDCIISGVNRIYMKMGMKLSAGIIFHLMGL